MAHDPASYRGRFRAGGSWRRFALGLMMGLASPGLTLGMSAVLLGVGGTMVVGGTFTPTLWAGCALGAVAMVVTICGYLLGSRRACRRALWGPIRQMRLAAEVACVCALMGWLAWSLVLWESRRIAGF